jgi:exoribonuclease R
MHRISFTRISHFVLPGTELDRVAARLATTTYLLHECYPMLPRLLCDDLCRCVARRLAVAGVGCRGSWQLGPISR